MLMAVKIIGFVIAVLGCIIVLSPNVFRAVANFWKKGKNVYLAGVMRLIFGVIFLLAAPQCRSNIVISVLGVLMIIGAIFVFVLRPAKIHTILAWWERKPNSILRLAGVVALAIGGLILYSA